MSSPPALPPKEDQKIQALPLDAEQQQEQQSHQGKEHRLHHDEEVRFDPALQLPGERLGRKRLSKEPKKGKQGKVHGGREYQREEKERDESSSIVPPIVPRLGEEGSFDVRPLGLQGPVKQDRSAGYRTHDHAHAHAPAHGHNIHTPSHLPQPPGQQTHHSQTVNVPQPMPPSPTGAVGPILNTTTDQTSAVEEAPTMTPPTATTTPSQAPVSSSTFSARIFLALKSKPTLTRTWEKKAFTEELRSAPLAESSGLENVPRGSFVPSSRPTSLYASPSAIRSFRPLPQTAPTSPSHIV